MTRFQREDAEDLLAAMRRGNRERLLDLLAEEYTARGGRRGAIDEIAKIYHYHRVTIRLMLEECEATGRLAVGTLPRRPKVAQQ